MRRQDSGAQHRGGSPRERDTDHNQARHAHVEALGPGEARAHHKLVPRGLAREPERLGHEDHDPEGRKLLRVQDDGADQKGLR